MCLYNGDNPTFFNDALESVYNQSLKPDEVVLQIDGPINAELENVVSKYQKSNLNFKVFRLKENMGHGIARNESLIHCSHDIVAIADADDINRFDRFEKQIEHFKTNGQLSAVSSACYHFSESINEVSNIEKLPSMHNEIVKYLKKRCPLCQASTMFKKNDVLKAGGYQDWYHAEDYYLWIRMFLNNARFENDIEPLIYVRTTKEQSKRRGGMKYFKSLRKLFKFMLKNKVITVRRYLMNVTSRFIIQVIFPNKVRIFLRKLLQ